MDIPKEHYETFKKLREFNEVAGEACGTEIYHDPVRLEPGHDGIYKRNREKTAFLQVIPGRTNAATPDQMRAFFQQLRYLDQPACLEILGNAEEITYQLVCASVDGPRVDAALTSIFPGSYWVGPSQDRLIRAYRDELNGSGMHFQFIELALRQPFFAPLAMPSSFRLDPLDNIHAVFAGLPPPALGVYQVLMMPTIVTDWAARIETTIGELEDATQRQDRSALGRYVTGSPNRPIGTQPRDLRTWQSLASAKLGAGRQFFIAVARCGIAAPPLAPQFLGLCGVFDAVTNGRQPGNLLFRPDLLDEGAPLKVGLYSFVNRVSFRKGFPVNIAELSALAHFPSETVLAKSYPITVAVNSRPVPENLRKMDFTLGTAEHRGTTDTVTISAKDRLNHVYVIGASGKGKSTFFKSLIAQDLEMGNGFALIEPHADLINWVLGQIPDNRIGDVVVLNPSDADHPLPFNVLNARSELERETLAGEVISIFRRLTSDWGPRMGTILSHAITAMCEHPDPLTLEDLQDFLVDGAYRETILARVPDDRVRSFWRDRFKDYPKNAAEPVLTRLDGFLAQAMIRRLVTQSDMVNFRSLMDNGGIFLAQLEKGKLQKRNMQTLGSLVMAKLYQAAMSRTDIPLEKRRPFFVYIDEFQEFVTETMAEVLSGTRKFGLGLALAHQNRRQLTGSAREVFESALTNAYTFVSFTVPEDAPYLERHFSHFDREDLKNLKPFETIMRFGTADCDLRVHTATYKEVAKDDKKRAHAVLEHAWARTVGTPPAPTRKKAEERRAQSVWQ